MNKAVAANAPVGEIDRIVIEAVKDGRMNGAAAIAADRMRDRTRVQGVRNEPMSRIGETQ